MFPLRIWAIIAAIGGVGALLFFSYRKISYAVEHPETFNAVATTYLNRAQTSERRVIVLESVVVAKDSVITDRDSANATLSRTIKQIENYDQIYQREKDSLQMLADSRIGQMTYLQQISDLFQRLYQRGTLAKPKIGTPAPILTDSVVVGANLKTAVDLEVSEATGKKLQQSVSAKDARIEQLRIERLAKNRIITGSLKVNQDRLKQQNKGILRKAFNAPQRRFLKAQRDSLNKALITGESDLEKSLNRGNK